MYHLLCPRSAQMSSLHLLSKMPEAGDACCFIWRIVDLQILCLFKVVICLQICAGGFSSRGLFKICKGIVPTLRKET